MRANNFSESDLQTFSKARMFGWSFVFSLVMALNLAMFLAGPDNRCDLGNDCRSIGRIGLGGHGDRDYRRI